MILTRLSLNNFRQFDTKKFVFKKPWTIIVAPNAHGKSTIIEAVSLLSSGESPWEQHAENIIKLGTSEPGGSGNKLKVYDTLSRNTTRIEAEMETPDGPQSIAVALQRGPTSTTRKYYLNDSTTTRSSFSRTFKTVLFSPDLIDVLMFEPGQRRNFLDTHAGSLFPEYSATLSNYKKVLRQRNSLLRAFSRNGKRNGNGYAHGNGFDELDRRLKYWTEQLIDLGSEVIRLRLQLIDMINNPSDLYPTRITYRPNVDVHNLASLSDASYIRERFMQKLTDARSKEIILGMTLAGPHRDDWFLTVDETNLNIFGSRGEKRMAIADIIFKINHILQKELDLKPVLLLDDITSELDNGNIDLLFTQKIEPGQQTIITTTHLDQLPGPVQTSSHIIKI